MATVILSLHYPKTGIVQTQEYPNLHQALTIAHSHFAAFPDGFAQISDKESEQIVMPNEELRGTFEMSRRRDDMPAESAAAEPQGFFARLFGPRDLDNQAG